MKGFLRGYDGALSWAFATIIGVNFVQVLCRYVLDSPIGWGEEFMRYAMIWVVMLAPLVLILEDDHIAAFEYRGESGWVRAARIASCLGVMVVGAVLVWQGVLVAGRNMAQLAPASQLPMAVPYAALPVGGAVTVVASLMRIVRLLRRGGA